LDLSIWRALYLYQYLSLLAVYVVASVIAAAYIFWTYKPHQNRYVSYIIYSLQLTIALHYISPKNSHHSLIYLIIVIVVSKILTVLAQYLWLWIKHILSNLIQCLLKSLSEIIVKITNLCATLLLTFINSFTKAVNIYYNSAKTFARAVFSWIWAWSICVLVRLRTSSKYARDLLAVSIWYTKYFCGLMMAIYQATVSTIKQLCMGVWTDILSNETRR
jgi:hypothetical protein